MDMEKIKEENEIEILEDLEDDLLTEECLEAIENANEDTYNLQQNNMGLRNLNIMISWKVPQSHTIETLMSHAPTPAQVDLIKSLGIQFKSGPFVREEDIKIMENFQQFCKEHDLNHDATPFLRFCYKGKKGDSMLRQTERKKFVQYIGKGLPDRKLYSIYRRFQVLFSKWRKGRFDEREDRIILHYVNKFSPNDPNRFSTLSMVLNRPRLAIEKRYITLERNQTLPSMTLRKKAEVLIKEVMRELGVNSVEELRGKKVKSKHWREIAKRMCYNQHEPLRKFWMNSIQTRLYMVEPLNINKIMKEIVERIYEEKIRDFRQLNWKELAKPYKDQHCTAYFLYVRFKNMASCIPVDIQHNLRKVVKHLRMKYMEGKILRRIYPIEFVDGRIVRYSRPPRSEDYRNSDKRICLDKSINTLYK